MTLLGGPLPPVVGGLCGFAALGIAIYQIVMHLRNYTRPVFQRYIVRIIFMVPLYALMSFLSLLMEENSVYFGSIRDCYEAWVIYNFLSLCLAYVGGPGSVEVKMNGYVMNPSWLYCTCCMPPLAVNGAFVRMCKRGALQFVFLKPVLAVITVVLYTQHKYTEGYWGANNGYLWITILYNVTYSIALYALVLFYMGTHELLAPFNPLLKFAVVKAVVFLTFWQGLFIAILQVAGSIKTVEDGKNLQNFLICLEMLPAALGMLWAFPYTEYKGSGANTGLGLENMRHVISIHDVVSDTMHQFAPTYHNYVLYSNGGSKEAPKTVKAKTFVAVGHETANKGEGGKNLRRDTMDANLLANMELGVHSDAAPGRHTSDMDGSVNGVARTTTDDDAFYRTTRDPLEVDEEGIEMSSAPVTYGDPDKKGKGVVRKVDSDDDEAPGPSATIDIHDEDYVPSAVPPAAVMEANKPKKPAKEGKLARQKAKAAASAPHSASALSHGQDDLEFVPPAALPQPQPKKGTGKATDASPPKGGKEWDDIDLSSPQP
ncbi:Transmembrane protein 184B at N-terminal half [Coccomyxa sp. Obi]|nr:Transmembrane protein 184B at N-terminal half [Coccomyxa sp. Obi]